MLNLAQELKELGCEMAAWQFREVVADVFFEMYRSWTDEQLKNNPKDAVKFCIAVRRAAAVKGLRDDVILGTLTNMRKAGGFKTKKRKGGQK